MSYTSQVTNNRSMNGIISFDDGNGGILENGQLTADNSNVVDSQVETLSIENQLNLDGNIKANNLLISPLWVSYLYGLTGNIQSQFNNIVVTLLSNNNNWTGTNTFNNTVNFNGIVNGLTKFTVGLGNVDNTSDLNKPISSATQTALNLKSNIASPTFTGNVTLPTTYNNNFQYFRNVGPVLPTVSSQVFGAISTNYQSGHADVDFWNCYGSVSNTSAFRFYNIDNTTTPTPVLLLNIMRNGYGNFNCAGGITLPSGQIFTFLGNITANSITITPVALSRIANLTSDAQTQIDGLQTQINAIPANFLSSNNIFTGVNQFNNVTTFVGNISANSITITPTVLSRISGLTSDAQIQFNNLQSQINTIPSTLLAANNTFTGTNQFNNTTTFTGTVNGLNKSTVGLNNVDNTSDVNKPVSTATQTALNLKANLASPTFSGTVVFPTTYQNGAIYFRNYGPTIPPAVSNMFGAITTNYQSGHADVDFWNTWRNSNGATSAFRFYNINADESTSLLFNMLRSGNASILGVLTTAGATLTGALTGTTATFSGAVSATSATITGALTGTSAIFSSTIQSAGATFTNVINGTSAIFSSTKQSAGATFTGTIFGTSANFSSSLQAAFMNITGSITSDSITTNSLTAETMTINSAISGDIVVTNNITSNQGIISGRYFRGLTALQTSPISTTYKWFDNAGTGANLPSIIVLNQNSTNDFLVYLPDPNKLPDLPIDGARTREGISLKIYFWVARYCQIYCSTANFHLPGTDTSPYTINGAKSQCLEFMVLRPNASSSLQWCLLN